MPQGGAKKRRRTAAEVDRNLALFSIFRTSNDDRASGRLMPAVIGVQAGPLQDEAMDPLAAMPGPAPPVQAAAIPVGDPDFPQAPAYVALAADLPVEADPEYDGFHPLPDEYGDMWFDAEEAFDEDPDDLLDAEGGIQEEPLREEPGEPPRSDTGAYLHYSLAKVIHEDHDVTLREVAVWLARLASDHRLPNAAMDSLCQMIHFLLLPPGNLFPRSYHMLK
eukprot:jgi/Ulvmu1/2902/UM146_0045.1